MDGWVYALAVSGTNLYAGGDFDTAGGKPSLFIAKWVGDTMVSIAEKHSLRTSFCTLNLINDGTFLKAFLPRMSDRFANISITDINGRLFLRPSFIPTNGISFYNISHFPAGVYIFTLKQHRGFTSKPFVVVR
jgi:hypothetical protein